MKNEPEIVIVSYYDHSVQSSDDTFTLQYVQTRPMTPVLFEEVGWLVLDAESFLIIACRKEKRRHYQTEYEYGQLKTILKSTIIEYNELTKLVEEVE